MKTITEFFGKSLKTIEEKLPTITKEATATATETLKAEGKSEEEMTAALPEAIKAAVAAKLLETDKLEGDKLAMCLAAIEVAKSARGSLKRVLVMTAAEGEKAPAGAKEVDGKYYLAEVFPEAGRPAAPDARDDRFGGKGKRDGKGGRGGKGGGRDGKPGGGRDGGRGGADRGERSAGGRPERAERPQAPSNGVVIGVKAGGAAGAAAPGHVPVPKGDRPARAPKAPRAPVEPYTGPNRIAIGGAPVVAAASNSAPTNTESSSENQTDGSST
jgi:hypothetical protein